METDNAGHKKIFCSPKERAMLKTKKYNNDFRKVVISNAIPDAQRDLHTSKYKRPSNKPDDGNRQNAIMFARANNSDLLRALKHLIETRLDSEICLAMCYK